MYMHVYIITYMCIYLGIYICMYKHTHIYTCTSVYICNRHKKHHNINFTKETEQNSSLSFLDGIIKKQVSSDSIIS